MTFIIWSWFIVFAAPPCIYLRTYSRVMTAGCSVSRCRHVTSVTVVRYQHRHALIYRPATYLLNSARTIRHLWTSQSCLRPIITNIDFDSTSTRDRCLLADVGLPANEEFSTRILVAFYIRLQILQKNWRFGAGGFVETLGIAISIVHLPGWK